MWIDRVRGRPGPVYSAIVSALEEAIRAGELHVGDRLPPQRLIAGRLGIDLTTVTRAYTAARERGLLEGAAGRGTYVRGQAAGNFQGAVDLAINVPPPPEGLSLGAALSDAATTVLKTADASILMGYQLYGAADRAAGARWMAPMLGDVAPERVLISGGAQAGVSAVLLSVCKPGDTVIVEPLTFSATIVLARRLGLNLVSCPADDEGLLPDALERLCASVKPAVLYVIPTDHNPMTTTTTQARRRAIAKIAQAHDLWVVEADPFGRLPQDPAPAIATFAPERTFYVSTLSKVITPGLRIAYVVPPPEMEGRVLESMQAQLLLPAPPLMRAIATRWIQSGRAFDILDAVRVEARARRALAARLLPQALGGAESIHIWLPLESAQDSERLRVAARERGVNFHTAEVFAVSDLHPEGARITLGGVASRRTLEQVLSIIANLSLTNRPRPLVI